MKFFLYSDILCVHTISRYIYIECTNSMISTEYCTLSHTFKELEVATEND